MIHNRQSGFSYIGLLIAIAILGALLAQVAVLWHTSIQRERERELLEIGDAFRNAIERYYQNGQVYPMSLEDLILDKRVPFVRRYLRKIYRDPITGSAEWGIVRGPGNSIAGVYSTSEDAPIKTANFGRGDESFVKKKYYSEWKFLYSAGVPLAPADQAVPQPSQDQPAQPAPVQQASPSARRAYICRVLNAC